MNEKRVLSLIIKQKYFDEILLGNKTTEEREIRPSSQKKYCQVDEEGNCVYDEEKGIFLPRDYDAIRFYVGYNKDRQTALVEVKGSEIVLFTDENGEFVELEEKGEPYLAAVVVYSLGAILERPADFTEDQVQAFCQAVYSELKAMGLDEQNARGWAFGGSSEAKKQEMRFNTPRQLAETYMM